MTPGVYVGVASSVEPLRHVLSGLRRLHAVAPVEARSRFVRTPAIGRPGDPDFVNGVVRVRTDLDPRALKAELRRIEAAEGRVRGPDPYAPRTLDLDVLLHGRLLDPDVLTRRFLAVALLELQPGLRLPDGSPLRDPGGPPLVEEPAVAAALDGMLAGTA